MAWEHLSITKPHLVYIILGGFTSLFMLCSSVIKERLYIGEATVATLCGIIFGPHAANLINPLEWGNTDLITLEFSRIVLVVQCFAVGVELPKAYMERHWRSVAALLIPVMTFGWLMTSLFIWGLMSDRLDWLDSLCIAACVTATDPVLASSVVGKGKFAKRVPKHLRDLLSAESGCNDGMAFPFIYLAVYIIRYKHHPNEVALHWFCYTILYECIFGAVYGVAIGYIARRLIRSAHEHDLIDRESFLVFYFVLALFCAGSGSLLGMDDLLIGFACGVGFSNDGWFLEKTEESHVSNVIDLLINLTFFVYFGTIIPWEQYNSPDVLGTTPWKLVVIGILVLLFRRIPVMMAMMPAIPDIKTWREALFAGHFGPIGVGAIFVAILARAELETEETTPLADLPAAGFPHLNIIELIWPITTFLVICSIVVHGSSIAVFTLGKHINTLTLTLSYTQATEEGPSWMDRLPRIQSRSKSSMSLRRPDETDSSYEDKPDIATEGPFGLPRNFLRRQKDDEAGSRSSSRRPSRRKKWEGIGPGGPISQSAIAPVRREQDPAGVPTQARDDSETTALNSDESPMQTLDREKSPGEEVYQEGHNMIIEDEEGNVLEVRDTTGETEQERNAHAVEDGARLAREKHIEDGVAQTEDGQRVNEAEKVAHEIKDGVEHPGRHWRDVRKRLQRRHTEGPELESAQAKPKPKHGPALAYQFGNTIIVEDEDGEVIKKYDIPGAKKKPADGEKGPAAGGTRQRLQRMGTYLGMSHGEAEAASQGDAVGAGDVAAKNEAEEKGKGPRDERRKKRRQEEESDDEHIRFTVTAGGRRMSKAEFIAQIQQMDPKARAKFVENSDVPHAVKKEARDGAKEAATTAASEKPSVSSKQPEPDVSDQRGRKVSTAGLAHIPPDERDQRRTGPEGLTLIDSNDEEIPFHSVRDAISGRETAAQQRRRRVATTTASPPQSPPGSSHSLGSKQQRPSLDSLGHSPSRRTPQTVLGRTEKGDKLRPQPTHLDEGETAAERRRREGALGLGAAGANSDSESEEEDVTDVGKGIRRPPAEKRAERDRERERAASAAALKVKEEMERAEMERAEMERAEREESERLEKEKEREKEKEKEREEGEAEAEVARSRTPGVRFAEPTRPPQEQSKPELGGSQGEGSGGGGGSGGGSGSGNGNGDGGNGRHHHRRTSSGLRWGRNVVGRERK